MDKSQYPDCVVYPDNRGQWLLYADHACDQVIAFFTTREDAEAAQRFFSSWFQPPRG